MKKFNKNILSLVLALVLFAVVIFPVAAVGESEESVHVHDETCASEVAASEPDGVGEVGVNDVGCIFGFHDFKYYTQFRAEGTLVYDRDETYCFTEKEKWTVIDKCTKCGKLRELVAPGAIISQPKHNFVYIRTQVLIDGLYKRIIYECSVCSYPHIIVVENT